MESFRRHQRCRVLLLAVVVLGGCARYEARPLDADVVHADWLAIDPTTAASAVTAAWPGDDGADGFELADGINLAEAEALALFFNPELRVLRLRRGGPEAAAEHAMLWEDPELGIDGSYILADVDEPLLFGAGLSLTIPLSGRRGARRALAQAEGDQLAAEIIGAEWAVLTQVREQWAAFTALRAQDALFAAAMTEIDELLKLVPQLRDAGLFTSLDEGMLRLQRARVVEAQAAAHADAGQLSLVLVRLLGLHPAHEWLFTPSRAELTALLAVPADIGIDAQLAEHPQVERALASYAVSERQLALEVRKQYPDLTLGLGAGSEDGDARVHFAFGLLPIPFWNSNQLGIATAEVDRAVAGAELASAVQAVVQAHHAAQHAAQAEAERVKRLRNDLAPLVDQQLAEARRLVALGQADALRVTEALTQARELRAELLAAEYAELAARLRVLATRGPQAAPLAIASREEP